MDPSPNLRTRTPRILCTHPHAFLLCHSSVTCIARSKHYYKIYCVSQLFFNNKSLQNLSRKQYLFLTHNSVARMGWLFFELSLVQFLSILVVSRAHGEGQKQKCDDTLPFPLTVPLANNSHSQTQHHRHVSWR